MSLTDSEVRGYKAGEKRQVPGCGDSLFLVVEPIGKGGGKSFMGVMRFPPCSPKNGGKRVEYRIGPYGKGVGKWSLKEARNEWERVRTWSRENNRDPRELKKDEQQIQVQDSSGPTFAEACKSYLSHSSSKASKKEYPNLLNHQVIPRLGGDTPVAHLSWDHKGTGGKNGRERVMEIFRSKVADGKAPQADKLLMVMRGVFDHAIDQGWMERNQNPALGTKGTNTKHKATPHPTLPWDQLPQFFDDLERNQANGTLVLCSAVKVVLMTFLRVGSLTPMRWEELDESKDLWVIPGTRMKTGHDHLVPLTDPLKEVLDSLRKVSGDEEFVFASPRSRSTPYLNPYSINQHFIRMGYKGVQTAHGLRRTALTAGQDVLGFPAELIQRQLSHAIGDKVRQSYDDSTLLEERRKFMISWCDALLAQGMKV
jgi:integrase